MIGVHVLIGLVADVSRVARPVLREERRVVVEAHEIRAARDQYPLGRRELRQARLVEALLRALLRYLPSALSLSAAPAFPLYFSACLP